MRTAPEECNLAANQHHQDCYNAEFYRSYMTKTFPGSRFLRLTESEVKAEPHQARQRLLPVRANPVGQEIIKQYHIEDFDQSK